MAAPKGNTNASGKRSKSFVERMKVASLGNSSHLGYKHSEETRRKISLSRKGKTVGETNPNWRGGVTPENYAERRRFRRELQGKIFARDNYTCQICSVYGKNIQVDHIQSWAEFPDLRFEESNCRTVCMACHYYLTFKRKLPQGVVWGHNLSKRISQ